MKIWSKRGEDIDKSVQGFLCGSDILNDGKLVQWDILGSIAHAKALEKARAISPGECRKLVAALRKLLVLHKNGDFRLDESLEDVHSNVEAWLTRELGDLGKKVHMGRSRNDQAALDMALYSKAEMLQLCSQVSSMCNSLLRESSRYRCPMPGYTHSRKAMIGSVQHWLLAHSEMLLNDLELMLKTIELIDKCPLGAAAGYGSIIPLDRRETAKTLGFSSPHVNTLAAIGSRGKTAMMVASSLNSVMADLSALATELILYSGEGFLSIPKGYCTGSSIMPHKSNPDSLELVRAKAARVLGIQVGVSATVMSLPLGYHRDIQETKGQLMEAFEITKSCVAIMDGVISGMKADEKACEAACTQEMALADMATRMSMGGVPFRDAFRSVRSAEGDLSDPRKNISLKTHLGAPGDRGMEKQLGKRLAALERDLKARSSAFRKAIAGLASTPS